MESVAEENLVVLQGDALLIQLVSNFPCLYDKSSKEYRNQSFRETAWVIIADVVQMTPSECMKRWGQLRDNFGREKRRREDECRSGSGLSQRRGFTFYEEMRFLEQHVHKRKTFTNVQNSPQSSHGYEHNSQLTEGYLATISSTPRGGRTINNFDAVQSNILFQPAGVPLLPPVTITSSQSTATATYALPEKRSFSNSTDKMTCPPLSTTPSIRAPHIATTEFIPITATQFQPVRTALPYSPPILTVPLTPISKKPATDCEISTPQLTMTTTGSPLKISSTNLPMTKSLSHTYVITPPVMTPPVSPIVRTSSLLYTRPDSPVSLLNLPSPATTPIPISTSTTTNFDSPEHSTQNTLSTPTPSPHTTTPTDHMVSSWSTRSVSPCISDSSSQSFTPTATSQTNDQWCSTPPPEMSLNPHSMIERKSAFLKNNRSRLCSNIEATTCFNKKLEKSKKTDPIESSFLSLSTAIQQHFTKRMQTEDKVKNNIIVPRSDEAFANLIVAELANLDEEKRAVKKAKLLSILYEQ